MTIIYEKRTIKNKIKLTAISTNGDALFRVILLTLLFFYGILQLSLYSLEGFFDPNHSLTIELVFLFICIRSSYFFAHYFTDGIIWKNGAKKSFE
jgi:hypothetical protein